MSSRADVLLDSGDEAGTAPADRRFRPDVEGLRAVSILLVVLYHAGVPGLTGGFVGVDVFFVISGFVITGLLLRERKSTGGTSCPEFLRTTVPTNHPGRHRDHSGHRGLRVCSPGRGQWEQCGQ